MSIQGRFDEVIDQLCARSRDGGRRYGCDEWSAPIVNLNQLRDKLEELEADNEKLFRSLLHLINATADSVRTIESIGKYKQMFGEKNEN